MEGLDKDAMGSGSEGAGGIAEHLTCHVKLINTIVLLVL